MCGQRECVFMSYFSGAVIFMNEINLYVWIDRMCVCVVIGFVCRIILGFRELVKYLWMDGGNTPKHTHTFSSKTK